MKLSICNKCIFLSEIKYIYYEILWLYNIKKYQTIIKSLIVYVSFNLKNGSKET